MPAKNAIDPKSSDPKAVINDLATLIAAMNRVTDHLQKGARNAGERLTLTDWLLLHMLETEGAQPVAKAAFKLGVSRQCIHQLAAAMEKSGHVTSKPGDGKSKELEISPSGRQLAAAFEAEILKAIRSVDGGIAAGPILTAKGGATRLARAMMLTSRTAAQAGRMEGAAFPSQ